MRVLWSSVCLRSHACPCLYMCALPPCLCSRYTLGKLATDRSLSPWGELPKVREVRVSDATCKRNTHREQRARVPCESRRHARQWRAHKHACGRTYGHARMHPAHSAWMCAPVCGLNSYHEGIVCVCARARARVCASVLPNDGVVLTDRDRRIREQE